MDISQIEEGFRESGRGICIIRPTPAGRSLGKVRGLSRGDTVKLVICAEREGKKLIVIFTIRSNCNSVHIVAVRD